MKIKELKKLGIHVENTLDEDELGFIPRGEKVTIYDYTVAILRSAPQPQRDLSPQALQKHWEARAQRENGPTATFYVVIAAYAGSLNDVMEIDLRHHVFETYPHLVSALTVSGTDQLVQEALYDLLRWSRGQ